jgi:hypothetical protein
MAGFGHKQSCNRLKQSEFDETNGNGERGTGNGKSLLFDNCSARVTSGFARHSCSPFPVLPIAAPRFTP